MVIIRNTDVCKQNPDPRIIIIQEPGNYNKNKWGDLLLYLPTVLLGLGKGPFVVLYFGIGIEITGVAGGGMEVHKENYLSFAAIVFVACVTKRMKLTSFG